jgi:hypothetical protein
LGDPIDSTQPASRARLDAAIELALRTGPARVDAADAATWLPPQMAQASIGITTFVYQTIVRMHLPHCAPDSVQSALHEACHRANEANPLAWLRFELPARERTVRFKLTE